MCVSICRSSLVVLSLFYIHLSFANLGEQLQGVNPKQLPNVIQILTQVMGQSEAECGSGYKDTKPTNEDFCSNLSMPNLNCPATQPSSCSSFIRDIRQLMDEVETAVTKTLDNGDAVCHCCMVPSMCLFPGGIGRMIDLLRVGNYAGLLLGLNNNKICAAIEKTQHISMGLDTASGLKCVHKGGRCRETHGMCAAELEKIKKNIEVFTCVVSVSTGIAQAKIPFRAEDFCQSELQELDGYISSLEESSERKCGTASRAGQNQLMQAALTGVASLVARECKKDHERNTKCDDKEGVELDECCENHPRADACKSDTCEGKEGTDLDACCLANPDSTLCAGHVNSSEPCHATQLINNAGPCMDKCKEDPSYFGCANLCRQEWNAEICPEVCKTYPTISPMCAEAEPGNACDSASDQVCCANPSGPDCEQFCLDNPGSSYCQCMNNPGRCRCDNEADIPYIPEGQCSSDFLSSTNCEDPNDPACSIEHTTSADFPGRTTSDDGGNNDVAGNSPWPGPPPFLDGSEDGSRDGPGAGGPTSYGGGDSSGGVGGGLSGGGLGGGGGSDEGEAGEGLGEDGEDPYENILAGLSGNQNQPQGFGGAGGGRGGRSGSGSGFDLKKFLPKDKKKKKAVGADSEDRAPSSMDSVFDISSKMMGRYCENNNMNCIQK